MGAPVRGRRVLIVDDVITAGTAIREAVDLLKEMGANIVAVAVCLDRQERASETSTTSAIQVCQLVFVTFECTCMCFQLYFYYFCDQM